VVVDGKFNAASICKTNLSEWFFLSRRLSLKKSALQATPFVTCKANQS